MGWVSDRSTKVAAGFLWSLPCKFYHVRVSCNHFSMDFGCSQGWRWRFLRSRRVASNLGMWVDLSEKWWFQSNIQTGIFRSKGRKFEKEWLEMIPWKAMQLWIFKLNFVSEIHQLRLRHKFFQYFKLVSQEQSSWYPTMSWGGAWWQVLNSETWGVGILKGGTKLWLNTTYIWSYSDSYLELLHSM